MATNAAVSPSLPPFARDVLELYETVLADVRFPDVDVTTLQQCAEALREAQEEVERLDAELQAAQERVVERTSTLLARADRALAYARIFTEDNAELSARVSAITGSAPGEEPSAGTARKRGKSRKPAAPSESQLDIAAED